LSKPNLRLIAVEHGGHLGFVSKNKPRLWLDGVLIQWMEELEIPQTRNKVAEPSVL
jgi:predicted alpha/beta-fold hydrolase